MSNSSPSEEQWDGLFANQEEDFTRKISPIYCPSPQKKQQEKKKNLSFPPVAC